MRKPDDKNPKDFDTTHSTALEQTLANQPNNKLAQQWLAQNKNAIDAHNKTIDKNGVFSDSLRCF